MGVRIFGVLLLVQACLSTTFFEETFDGSWEDRWTAGPKTGLGKFVAATGKHFGDASIDVGLQTSEDAKFYATSTKFASTFSNMDKPLVIQFSIKHEQNIDCGGGYVKVMPGSFEPTKFDGDSEYYVMFGPDICGSTKKIHFIFGYKGENLLWKKEPRAETDVHTHVYTAIVNPDGTYEVLVDNVKKESGNVADDWAFMKPKTIADPSESKPAEWVDEAQMQDPESVKPDGWDAISKEVTDPEASQPEDWDEEEDGEWEAPMVPNPEYKGEWAPTMIPNPEYKGPWAATEIPNPDYVEDVNVGKYEDIGAIGIDVWQVKAGTVFDNVIVTDSVEEAKAFYDKTTGATIAGEKASFDVVEAETKKAEEAEAAKHAEADTDDEDEDEDEDEEEDRDEL